MALYGSTESTCVIHKLKATFARFGIPEQIVSDNEPQFISEVWRNFCATCDIQHITSSPHNPQGNGHVEWAEQTAKRILKQEDPLLALMSFRATPNTSTSISPAELLMGRKIRTTLPTLQKNLRPKWPSKTSIREKDKAAKEQQAYYFNRRHGVKDLPVLRPGDSVLLKLDGESQWKGPAKVLMESTTPRSYNVSRDKVGERRRNRRHIQLLPEGVQEETFTTTTSPNQPTQKVQHCRDSDIPVEAVTMQPTITRSGRVSKPAVRLDL
uniref:Integrase catalytic domain-containing protein n=1 Tax=Paramormyrops kingsleyae TaxID=1676925 RepID=A0A3B3T9T2_9TELE